MQVTKKHGPNCTIATKANAEKQKSAAGWVKPNLDEHMINCVLRLKKSMPPGLHGLLQRLQRLQLLEVRIHYLFLRLKLQLQLWFLLRILLQVQFPLQKQQRNLLLRPLQNPLPLQIKPPFSTESSSPSLAAPSLLSNPIPSSQTSTEATQSSSPSSITSSSSNLTSKELLTLRGRERALILSKTQSLRSYMPTLKTCWLTLLQSTIIHDVMLVGQSKARKTGWSEKMLYQMSFVSLLRCKLNTFLSYKNMHGLILPLFAKLLRYTFGTGNCSSANIFQLVIFSNAYVEKILNEMGLSKAFIWFLALVWISCCWNSVSTDARTVRCRKRMQRAYIQFVVTAYYFKNISSVKKYCTLCHRWRTKHKN